MARSVTVLVKNAETVAETLGGIINGKPWIGLAGKKLVLVTVPTRNESLRYDPEFRKLKNEGLLYSWARA